MLGKQPKWLHNSSIIPLQNMVPDYGWKKIKGLMIIQKTHRKL